MVTERCLDGHMLSVSQMNSHMQQGCVHITGYVLAAALALRMRQIWLSFWDLLWWNIWLWRCCVTLEYNDGLVFHSDIFNGKLWTLCSSSKVNWLATEFHPKYMLEHAQDYMYVDVNCNLLAVFHQMGFTRTRQCVYFVTMLSSISLCLMIPRWNWIFKQTHWNYMYMYIYMRITCTYAWG